MAKRPKLNLMGSHFKDSYTAEIDSLKVKTALIRETMRMLMNDEFKYNTSVREYIEKSYRLLHQHMMGLWRYHEPG